MPRHNALPPATSSRGGIRASARDALTSFGVDSQRLHARADRILRYTSKTHAVYCRNALRRDGDIEMQLSSGPWDDVQPSDVESMDSTDDTHDTHDTHDTQGPLITFTPSLSPLPLKNWSAPLSPPPATVVSPLEIISPKPKRIIPDLTAYLEDASDDEAEEDDILPRTESPEPMPEFKAAWSSFPQPQIHEAPPSSASNSSASTDVSSFAKSFDWIPLPSSVREHSSSCPSFPEPRPFIDRVKRVEDHLHRFSHPNPDSSDSCSSLPSAFIFGDPMGFVAPAFPVPEPFVNVSVNGDVWNVVHMRSGQRDEHDPILSGPL